MILRNQSNVETLAVSNLSGALVVAGNIADLTEGQVAICNEGGEILDTDRKDGAAGSAFDKIQVAVYEGGQLWTSDVIEFSNIKAKTAKEYAAAVQQVSYIGYDGATSGTAIDVENGYVYEAKLDMTPLPALEVYAKQRMLKYGVYESGTSATQEKIAQGLAISLTNNFLRESEQMVKIERVCDETGTALTGTGNITVTKGSKTIVAASNIDAVLNVGDSIRLGAGITTAYPVYKIVAMDTATETATLDVPYQGASDVLLTATETISIAAADAAAAEWGIKLTSVARDANKVRPGVFDNPIFAFNLDSSDVADSNIIYTTKGSLGTGTVSDVANIEWFAQGNEGKSMRTGIPCPAQRALVDGTVNGYNLIGISWTSSTQNINSVISPKSVLIATNEAATATVYASLKTLFGIS